jgi:menaquinone-dependent protoporphyrinogen oxidase
MRTLIIYATKYGTTEKVVNILKEKINGNIDIINIKKEKNINISNYDYIIIGGSIYIGHMHKEITNFINSNLEQLLSQKVALFICAGNANEEEKELLGAFENNLLDNAIFKGSMGYEYLFDKLKFFDKFIVKKIVKVDNTVSNINYDNINKLVEIINGL